MFLYIKFVNGDFPYYLDVQEGFESFFLEFEY